MDHDLTAMRLNRGYSIRGLAKTIDVPEQSIRRAEGGERLSPENAFKLASFYGYQVTDVWPVDREPERDAA